MKNVAFRFALFAAPLTLTAAFWVGCSGSAGDGAQAPSPNANPFSGTLDAQVPPADAGSLAKARNCADDTDTDGVHKHLECTGLYADFASKAVRAENRAYTPGVTFWSDGADKSRFVYLPPGATIDITDFDEWKFPNGTKFWKEFRVGTKRVETRFYEKSDGSWRHTSYRWNDDESDALRKDNGDTLMIPGKPVYEVPNTAQCDTCHIGRTEPVLGFEAVGLGLANAKGVTLATLAAEGRFATPPPATAITIPNDHNGTAAPAIGWMHANCGACHNENPNSAAQFSKLFLLLRPSQLLPKVGTVKVTDLDSYKTSVNILSTRINSDTKTPYVRIVPRNPAASLTSILSGRRVTGAEDPNLTVQMPPLVTRVVDTEGHALLDAWINAIP